jgi:hypothetical protein
MGTYIGLTLRHILDLPDEGLLVYSLEVHFESA